MGFQEEYAKYGNNGKIIEVAGRLVYKNSMKINNPKPVDNVGKFTEKIIYNSPMKINNPKPVDNVGKFTEMIMYNSPYDKNTPNPYTNINNNNDILPMINTTIATKIDTIAVDNDSAFRQMQQLFIDKIKINTIPQEGKVVAVTVLGMTARFICESGEWKQLREDIKVSEPGLMTQSSVSIEANRVRAENAIKQEEDAKAVLSLRPELNMGISSGEIIQTGLGLASGAIRANMMSSGSIVSGQIGFSQTSASGQIGFSQKIDKMFGGNWGRAIDNIADGQVVELSLPPREYPYRPKPAAKPLEQDRILDLEF